MYVKIMISLSILALAIALFTISNGSYRIFLQFLICTSAVLVIQHAFRAQAEYLWGIAFCGIAVLFNPVVPVATSGWVFSMFDVVTIALFIVYYKGYRAKPRPSIASITDRTPGSESL
ncbi:MAG TPA: DUF6804 family protein [Candidatus Angelobacter sp.]|nr:DUF6804 family protein [Candidatus Angelobacter sp.]